MKITKKQLRRIIRETGRSEHGAEASGMLKSYNAGYRDAFRSPGRKRVGSNREYKRGYEKGLEDAKRGVRPPDDDNPGRGRMREADGSTKKYDDDSALKGDQSKLPDGLQKGIIDKTVEDREEQEEKAKEDKNESIMRITKRQLKRMIRESLEEETDLYVVIGNAGRGRQAMWPKSARPGVYSKTEAEAIAKEQNKDSRMMGGSIHYHAQPLSRDLLGGRYGVQPGNEAYIGLEELIQDYESGGLLSDEESYERGFYEGKTALTKQQLRKIIKEEKAKILEQDIPGQESPELRQAAADLGSLMAGQPPTAHAVAKALKDRYPGAAADLLAAYNKAQQWIDVEWMD